MANNRLYLVNTETNEYILLAKSFIPWEARFDTDELTEFLSDVYEGSDIAGPNEKIHEVNGRHPFILVSEGAYDNELYQAHIANGTKFKP